MIQIQLMSGAYKRRFAPDRLRRSSPVPFEQTLGMLDHFRWPGLQYFREPKDRSNSRALQSALKQTDEGAIKAAFKPEILLGDRQGTTHFAEGVAECSLRPVRWLNLLL